MSWRNRVTKVAFACTVTMAMLVAGMASISVVSETAEARGPAYDGPTTASTGPAFFGPAPNPFPYCDSPTYFDPFQENETPIGRMGVGSTASVTTDGLTMDLVITSEGNPGTQYPGFFPEGGDGDAGDQPKGIELAEGDGASVTLSEPLFYSQWIFTDVDRVSEGFTVTPQWTEVGQAAVFGGDDQFTLGGTPAAVQFDDLDAVAQASESINGRVQVDFLGAVNGIDMLRTSPSSGQSGFAVGGGCEAAGAAKAVVAGPTWNPDTRTFDVTYELRMRNNLPSSATIQAVINDAVAAVGTSFVTDTPQGIALTNLQLTDDLSDPAFSNITVTALTTDGALNLNFPGFNGTTDQNLITSGVLPAESDEVITLSVAYTPDLSIADWDDCQAGFDYENQTEVTGSAAGVTVADLSDNGLNAAPSNDNGEGGVDDPTPVNFPCPPAELEIVKTVVPGPNGTCPSFAAGVQGLGDALQVQDEGIVTYCVSVLNSGVGVATNVVVSDPQGPGDFALPDLAGGATDTVSYDIQVTPQTPTVNTATVNGSDSNGPLPEVEDPAQIEVVAQPQPDLQIVKTVVSGPNGLCPSFANGVPGLGDALVVNNGDTVTYCISVLNGGPGAANDVVISDDQAPQDYAVGTLTAGATASESYDLTVTATTALVNVAAANGTNTQGVPVPEVTDDAQISRSLQPSLEIVKTVVAGPNGTCPDFENGVVGIGPALVVSDGGTVTYCVSVRNIGPGVATGVTISDAQLPGPIAIGTLAAGQEAPAQAYDINVTLQTPPVNTASVTGFGPGNTPLPPVTDDAQITPIALPDPVLEIVKTALAGANAQCPTYENGIQGIGDPVQLLSGESVTYCLTVINSGLADAENVIITDTQAPDTFALDIGDLAVGEQVTRQYNLVVDLQTPTLNTATVNGDGPNGAVPEDSDTALIAVSPQPDPVLEIVKTVVSGPNGLCPATFADGVPGDGDALTVLYGNVATFCITVRNTGPTPATSVIVTDGQAPGPLSIGTIPAGQERSRSYDVVVAANTPPRNTATANGNGPNGGLPSVSDTALIEPTPQPDPVLEIVKTVVPGPNGTCPATFAEGTPGDGGALAVLYTEVVTYCITVLNSSGRPATNVVITDPQAPGAFSIGTLNVGQEASRSFDLVVSAATPLVNTATVNGQGPNGPVGPVSDTALIDPSPQPDPVLEIVKTVVPGPNGTCPATFDEGVPGDGAALTVLYTDSATYCVSVRNAGPNVATNVVINDAQAPGPLAVGALAVGQEANRQYDVLVNANTPPQNTATATGVGPNGALTPVSDTALITPTPQPDPILEIVKTVVPGPNGVCPAFADGVAGDGDPLAVEYTDTVTYCITVTNTGGNTATGVSIADPQAPTTYNIGLLAVGAVRTVSYDVIIDADTPERNIATVTGNGPNGELPPVQDPAVIDPSPLPDPALEIVKTVVEGPNGTCPTFANGTVGQGDPIVVSIDDTVTYCIAIQNTGLGIAENVRITDDQAPASPYEIGTLAPGAGATRAYDLLVTENSPLVNVAVVTGTGPNGPVPPADDDAVIQITDPVAGVSLIHSVVRDGEECTTVAKDLNSLVADLIGTAVTWCVEITNTGNTPLTNVVLNAPAIGFVNLDALEADGAPAVLLPGASVKLPVDSLIDANGKFSEAIVVADPSDAAGNVLTSIGQVSDDDTAETREASIELQTTVVATSDGDCANAEELIMVPIGTDVTWCFEVTNTGTIDLLVEEVTDVTLGVNVPVPTAQQRLIPGASVIVTTTSVATGDLLNRAEVSGQPLDLDGSILDQAPVVEDADPASVDTPIADPTITKSVSDAGPVPAGTELTYTLVVGNNGPDAADGVRVTDQLPAGLTYTSVPGDADWTCSLDGDERGFACLKATPLANAATATLTYTATVDTAAAANVDLVNTATVSSDTPDGDDTNNTDTEITQREPAVPPPPPPPPPLPEYPGPFTPEPPPPPPDEVLGLVITGTSSELLAMLSSVMLATGGIFVVGSRRRERDDEG